MKELLMILGMLGSVEPLDNNTTECFETNRTKTTMTIKEYL